MDSFFPAWHQIGCRANSTLKLALNHLR